MPFISFYSIFTLRYFFESFISIYSDLQRNKPKMFSFRHLYLLHRASVCMRQSVLRLSQRIPLEQHPCPQFAKIRLLSTNPDDASMPNTQSVTREETIGPDTKKSNYSKAEKPDLKIVQCLTQIMKSNRKVDKHDPEVVYKVLSDGNKTVDKQQKLQALISVLDSAILKGDVHSQKHIEILMTCQEFRELLSAVSDSIPIYSRNDLLLLLSCHLDFQILRKNIQAKSDIMENLLSNLNKLNISSLIKLHRTTKQLRQPEMENKVMNNIGSRWMEVEKVNDLMSIMQMITPEMRKTLDSSIQDGLEEKTLQKVEQLSTEQIGQVLEFLSVARRRNLPLIKSLAYCLKQKGLENFSMKMTASVFESLSKLNIQDNELLHLLSAHTVQIAKDSRKSIQLLTLILNCCAHLKWMTPDLEKLLHSYYPRFSESINHKFQCQAIANMSTLQCLQESDKEITLATLESLNEKNIRQEYWLFVALALGWNNWSVEWITASVLKESSVENIQSKFFKELNNVFNNMNFIRSGKFFF